MYIFGGYVGCEPTDTFFKYDFNFRMWRIVSSIKYLLEARPCPRAGHSALAVKDHMYLFGGKTAAKHKLNDLWKFHFRFDFWERISLKDNGPQPGIRSGHSCSFYQDYLIIFGGIRKVLKETNDCWAFNLNTKIWT